MYITVIGPSFLSLPPGGEQWTAEHVDNEPKRIMLDAFCAVCKELSRSGMTYRQAAFVLGVRRMLEVMRARGWIIDGVAKDAESRGRRRSSR